MPITNQDFMLTMHGTYGVPFNNVFFYRKVEAHAPTDAQDLYESFRLDVLPVILGVMVAAVDVNSVEVINLVDLSDYHVGSPVAHLGALATTNPAPTFTAYGLRYNRSTRAGRHGYKRFPGVAEELVSYGTTTVSGALVTAMPALTDVLNNIISAGADNYQPMIPHRVLTTMPDLTQQYLLNDLYAISSVTFYGLTTQNTRKAW